MNQLRSQLKGNTDSKLYFMEPFQLYHFSIYGKLIKFGYDIE